MLVGGGWHRRTAWRAVSVRRLGLELARGLVSEGVSEGGGLFAGGVDDGLVERLFVGFGLFRLFACDVGLAVLVELLDAGLESGAGFGGLFDALFELVRGEGLEFWRELGFFDGFEVDLLVIHGVDEVPAGVVVVGAGFGDGALDEGAGLGIERGGMVGGVLAFHGFVRWVP